MAETEIRQEFELDWGRGFYLDKDEYAETIDFWFEYKFEVVPLKMRRDKFGNYTPEFTISLEYFDLPENARQSIKTTFEINKTAIILYYEVAVRDESPNFSFTKNDLIKVLDFDLNEKEQVNLNRCLNAFTFIYLIKDLHTGLIKIGKSNTPAQRLAALKKQDTLLPRPNEFELIACWEAPYTEEFRLHEIFKNKRVRGEWFDLNQDDLIKIGQYFYDNIQWEKGRTAREISEGGKTE